MTEFGKRFRDDEKGSELRKYYELLISSPEYQKALAEQERKKELTRLNDRLNGKQYKKYCQNYQDIKNFTLAKADKFVGWQCHHRLETHTSDGERRPIDITVSELIALDMYYNRPASELVFLTNKEHRSLHLCGKPSMRSKNKKNEKM